ncbi:MAG: peptidase M16, partial [Ezakiella sp.]
NYCIDAGILPKTSGSDSVVRNMLSNSFLHDNIRAKGGAYGDGISQSDDCVVFYSYRDPNLQNTFDVFEKSMDWLRGRDLKEEQIDDLIIGSYNSFDPNLTPRMRSLRDFSYRINETSVEDLEKKLKEALATKKEDFADYADRLEAAMKNKGRAVFTNEDGYEKSKDMWQEKKDLK